MNLYTVYSIQFTSVCLPNCKPPIFDASYHTTGLCVSIVWCLAQALCQCYKVRYPWGLHVKPSHLQVQCRSVQITSTAPSTHKFTLARERLASDSRVTRERLASDSRATRTPLANTRTRSVYSRRARGKYNWKRKFEKKKNKLVCYSYMY